MARNPLDLWNHWSIQILVLVSLAIQVFLFVFSGTRRRGANPVLRLLLWQAYMMADTTATYALGHLSLSRKAVEEQKLVSFWSSFLLLHLGGPDSMTAYALQDNQLWPRHLYNLVVQVLGAAYVLYKLIATDGASFLVLAAILMFAVGVAKYGERTWALKRGNLSTIRSSMRKESHPNHHQFHVLDRVMSRDREGGANNDEELSLRHAHSLFHICKRAIVDSWMEKDSSNSNAMLMAVRNQDCHDMWILMETELSLLYDILYTKAAVIHTLPGYCIRVISSPATVASFLLFHLSDNHGQSRVDVAVTYTLLAGAFLLEATSLLNAVGSSWTYNFLCTTQWSWLRHTVLCTGRWDRIRRLIKTMVIKLGGGKARRWSGKMGQYNMLHLCSRRDTLLGRLAKSVGLKEWWNTKYYSGTIKITEELRKHLFSYTKQISEKGEINTQGLIRGSWGGKPLAELELFDEKKFTKLQFGVEFQESVIILHIATDFYLAKSSRVDDSAEVVKSIRTLSNYMMYLLVACPEMLPGLAQTRLYHLTCQNLAKEWHKHVTTATTTTTTTTMTLEEIFRLRDDPTTCRLKQRQDFATTLYKKNIKYSVDVPRLSYAKKVAEKLLQNEEKEKEENKDPKVLKGILGVWMDFLVYAANRCSRESHAKRLSRGSELTTVLWLMADYFHQDHVSRKEPSTTGEDVSGLP